MSLRITELNVKSNPHLPEANELIVTMGEKYTYQAHTL